jgi:hypothetical protein
VNDSCQDAVWLKMQLGAYMLHMHQKTYCVHHVEKTNMFFPLDGSNAKEDSNDIHSVKHKTKYIQADSQTNGQTDGWKDGRTDG